MVLDFSQYGRKPNHKTKLCNNAAPSILKLSLVILEHYLELAQVLRYCLAIAPAAKGSSIPGYRVRVEFWSIRRVPSAVDSKRR